jgi:threonine synthase
MGLPLNKLICASNENKIITDFINTGEFNLNGRNLKDTSSPAIDILNPSNIERLLYFITNDVAKVAEWYNQLKTKGLFQVDPVTLAAIHKDFEAFYCPESMCIETIKSTYQRTGFLLDPHTAVAKYVVDNFVKESKILIASTAHFGKFPESILKALNLTQTNDLKECFQCLETISSKPQISESLRSVLKKPVLHKDVVNADQMEIKNIILEKIIKNKI